MSIAQFTKWQKPSRGSGTLPNQITSWQQFSKLALNRPYHPNLKVPEAHALTNPAQEFRIRISVFAIIIDLLRLFTVARHVGTLEMGKIIRVKEKE